jgi:hypothetical protein
MKQIMLRFFCSFERASHKTKTLKIVELEERLKVDVEEADEGVCYTSVVFARTPFCGFRRF